MSANDTTNLEWMLGELLKEKKTKVCFENVKFIEHIGRGTFSNVYKGKLLDEKWCAIKHFNMNRSTREDVFNELEILKIVQHPHVVTLLGSFFHQEPFIVTKCCIGSLRESCPVSVENAIRFCVQLLDALSHVHSKRILHRDIKTENIFVTNSNNVVLGDFGSAVKIPQNDKSVKYEGDWVLGSPCYQNLAVNEMKIASYTSDMFSLGVVFFEQLKGDVLMYSKIPGLPPNNGQSKFYAECLRDGRIIEERSEDEGQFIPKKDATGQQYLREPILDRIEVLLNTHKEYKDLVKMIIFTCKSDIQGHNAELVMKSTEMKKLLALKIMKDVSIISDTNHLEICCRIEPPKIKQINFFTTETTIVQKCVYSLFNYEAPEIKNADFKKSNICRICMKAYKHQPHLSRHMLKHTTIKFTCNGCGAHFTRQDGLRRHKFPRNKTPEVCSCGFTTGRKSCLKRHKVSCKKQ